MASGSLAGCLALAAAGCARSQDVTVAWTIDGRPAVFGCEALADPELELEVRDAHEAEPSAEDADRSAPQIHRVPCADGEATLPVGPRSSVSATLLDGGGRVGGAGPLPITITDDPRDTEADDVQHLDIRLERGRLEAQLTVTGKRCGDVGVDAFRVTLRRIVGPLDKEVMGEAEGVDVACEEGDAVFSFAPVAIGSTYEVYASASSGEERWSTSDGGTGAGVTPAGAVTHTTVDLDVIARP